MDLSDLNATLDDGSGPGEDLEYEPVFTALELAAKPGEERQMGDEIHEAEEPNWREVREKALAVLERSKDLRAAVHLAHASLKLGGFREFAPVTTYIRRCLEEMWEGCHPMLDAEDDNDPTMRVNAVLGLADPAGILRAVRRAPLTESRAFGQFTLYDVEIAEGEIETPESMDNPPSAAAVAAAFQDTDADTLAATAAAVETALADVEAIDAKFDAETPAQGPNLDALLRALRRIRARLVEARGGEAGDADAAAEAGAAAAAPGAPAAAGGRARGVGDITSRKDVVTAIDRIIGYYAASEPSSPVPIILRRAKRLVDADFMRIMEDLAPDGMENVRVVVGRSEEEEEDS